MNLVEDLTNFGFQLQGSVSVGFFHRLSMSPSIFGNVRKPMTRASNVRLDRFFKKFEISRVGACSVLLHLTVSYNRYHIKTEIRRRLYNQVVSKDLLLHRRLINCFELATPVDCLDIHFSSILTHGNIYFPDEILLDDCMVAQTTIQVKTTMLMKLDRFRLGTMKHH